MAQVGIFLGADRVLDPGVGPGAASIWAFWPSRPFVAAGRFVATGSTASGLRFRTGSAAHRDGAARGVQRRASWRART